jgi:hypothetical protein
MLLRFRLLVRQQQQVHGQEWPPGCQLHDCEGAHQPTMGIMVAIQLLLLLLAMQGGNVLLMT